MPRVWVVGDTFRVNGQRQWYVRNARFEVQCTGTMLTNATGTSVSINGVIVVVGARGGFTVRSQSADGMVCVVGRKGLVEGLLRNAAILTSEQVSIIFDQVRCSTTWL
ncbi:MAG: hypothetical protein ACYDHP_11610 [Ferrimicrobium sp.]